MPPKDASFAKKWLSRAKSNLIRAQLPKPDGVYWEDLCYDSQQCVEKSIKALLIFYGIKFQYVHNISNLFITLKKNGIDYPENLNDAAILTQYAVESRYPVTLESATEEDYKEAISLAEKVYKWVESEIEKQLNLEL